MATTLMVLPGRVPSEVDERVARDERGRMEIPELAGAIRARGGDHIDFLNYTAVEADRNPLVRVVAARAGLQYAQALSAFFRAHRYDSIISYGESAAGPLGLLLFLSPLMLRSRPHHVAVVYDLTKTLTRRVFRWLGAHRGIDVLLVPSEAQAEYCIEKLGVSPRRVKTLLSSVDTKFYRPLPKAPSGDILIASAGASNRDHATLIKAVADLPGVRLKIDPTAGPRLKMTSIPDMDIPANVELVTYEPGGLRPLIAECDIVCVSVKPGLGTYGITTVLEGMAMGKPVIVTRNSGLFDHIREGETALTAPPGDVEGWRAAIRRLSQDRDLRERLAQNGRKWAEQNATLELWTERVCEALAGRRTRHPRAPGSAEGGIPTTAARA